MADCEEVPHEIKSQRVCKPEEIWEVYVLVAKGMTKTVKKKKSGQEQDAESRSRAYTKEELKKTWLEHKTPEIQRECFRGERSETLR